MGLGLVKAIFEQSLRETSRSPGVVDHREAGQIMRASIFPGRDVRDWLGGRLGADDAGFYDSVATQNRLRRHVGLEPVPVNGGRADLNTIKAIFSNALAATGVIDNAKARELINRAGRFPAADVKEWLKGRAGTDDRGFYDTDDTFNMMRTYVGLDPIFPEQPPASLAELRAIFERALGDSSSPGVVSWNEAQQMMRAAGRVPSEEVKTWLSGRVNPDDQGFYESRAVFNSLRNYLGLGSI